MKVTRGGSLCGLIAVGRPEEADKDVVGGSVWWAAGGGGCWVVIGDNINAHEDRAASVRTSISKAGPCVVAQDGSEMLTTPPTWGSSGATWGTM